MHESVIKEFERQVECPPGRDQRIAAFSKAVLEVVQTNPERPIMNVISQENRHDRTPSHIANIALRALQRQLMESDPTYPAAFDTVEPWHETFDGFDANQELLDVLKDDIEHRHVQSNVTERYKAFKLVMQLLKNKIGDEPSIIDIGCSRNLGLKKLRTALPFNDIELDMNREEAADVSLRTRRYIKEQLATPITISPSKGVDIEPLETGKGRSWPRSCSFYPSELLQTARVAEYDYLDLTEIDGVSFQVGDITNAAQFKDDEGSYDVVTASTFMYMLSEDQRQEARRVMRSLLRPNGIIIYQDFAKPGNDNDIEFESNWFKEPYLYRTLVEFADDPDHQPHEVLRWENGRCNKWIPGRDFSLIADAT